MSDKIDKKIIHYGAFKETLQTIVDLMRTEYPSSVVVRGGNGSGKRTLIQEAQRITGVRCIYICPYDRDDYSAIKYIASSLQIKRETSIGKLIQLIGAKVGNGDKLVVVLLDFEEFCKSRQSLLYTLMDMIQPDPTKLDEGRNITLIGTTLSVDWAQNLEKRVRSRLNAKCLTLLYPYKNSREYVEFAKLLIDNAHVKHENQFKEQLEYMYLDSRSIRYLKVYLGNICTSGNRDRISVNFEPDDYMSNYNQLNTVLLVQRLQGLTKSQLELLTMILYHCSSNSDTSFSMAALLKTAANKEWSSLPSNCLTPKNLGYLAKIGLLKLHKPDQIIGQHSQFTIGTRQAQFKAVIKMDETLQSIKTDPLCKKLK